MNIGLGTVQFGMRYGVTNQNGVPSPDEIAQILELAAEKGLRTLDTASLYGESEAALGRCLPSGHSFSIVTKTAKFKECRTDSEKKKLLEESFDRSLSLLKQDSVEALLFHDPDDLMGAGDQIYQAALQFKKQGRVKKVGVSVYTSQQIETLMQRYPLDIVQLPINVLDQRLIQTGALSLLKKKGIEIHARSAFLQGVLLEEPRRLPSYFDSVRSHLEKMHEEMRASGFDRLQTALGFLSTLQELDCVLVGVSSKAELAGILQAFERRPKQEINYKKFLFNDESILNPSVWKLG